MLLAPPPLPPQQLGKQKIRPAPATTRGRNPFTAIPIIIQMNPTAAPFSIGANATLAQQALSILQGNGQAFGALPVILGAAGAATPAAITAMSLLPQVAEIDLDAPVHVQRSSGNPTAYSSSPFLISLDVQEINAPRVWQQAGSGSGVTVAVVDSGVAEDTDLVQNGERILAHVNVAGP